MSDFGSLFRLSEKKGVLSWIAGLLLILTLGWGLYKEWKAAPTATPADTVRSISPRSTRRDSSSGRHAASFRIDRVQVTPVDFTIPTGLFIELSNSGWGTGSAELLVDLGASSIDSLEIRPAEAVSLLSGGSGGTSVKVALTNVSAGERVYLYALTSAPVFREIVLNPMDAGYQQRITFEEVRRNGDSASALPRAFRNFLWVIASIFVIVLAILAIKIVADVYSWLLRKMSSN
jgi:hypothetical protein